MKSVFLATVLVLMAQALAAQGPLPALFDVTGVASNDTLNVRRDPDPAAPIVGTLAPEARNIEVIEASPRDIWGRINIGEISGWVSLKYLERQPGQAMDDIPAIRRCYGTEPAWALTVDSDGDLFFSTPSAAPLVGRLARSDRSRNRPDRFAFALEFQGSGAAAMSGVTFVTRRSCSDQMSDRWFGLEADIWIGSADNPAFLSGCCSIAP